MANPNIVNVTQILANTVSGALISTANTTIISNDASSGKVIKVNLVRYINIDGTNSADGNLWLNDSGSNTAVISTVAIPADSALDVVNKNESIYLLEGQALQGTASADGDLVYLCSAEAIY